MLLLYALKEKRVKCIIIIVLGAFGGFLPAVQARYMYVPLEEKNFSISNSFRTVLLSGLVRRPYDARMRQRLQYRETPSTGVAQQ